MIEKIMLAIALTCSLAWSIQVKPPQRVVAVGINYPVEIFGERPMSVFITV